MIRLIGAFPGEVMDQVVAVVAQRLEIAWGIIAVIVVDVVDDKLAEKFRHEPAA